MGSNSKHCLSLVIKEIKEKNYLQITSKSDKTVNYWIQTMQQENKLSQLRQKYISFTNVSVKKIEYKMPKYSL